jgi:hypothetical protein
MVRRLLLLLLWLLVVAGCISLPVVAGEVAGTGANVGAHAAAAEDADAVAGGDAARGAGGAADNMAGGVAGDIAAHGVADVSVTVYRAPDRGAGSLDLDRLGGFALISETRTVHVPAGESRLRFEGVADGIEPASAIVTGLPPIIEKNREGQLLSPSALLAAAVGKPVMLERTNPKTGKTEQLPATLKSAADGGAVFETAQSIEALRCSGLPETFSFAAATNLSATPTLSVLVRSPRPTTATVTLSYLARGFDWAAEYVATLAPDGKTLDLGAWVTLANGNGVGFPAAHAQVVAGRLNRERGAVEPIDAGGPILARCWPRGSTSDSPEPIYIQRAVPLGFEQLYPRFHALRMNSMAVAAPATARVVVTAQRVEQEQLGDLKLYRVPGRTTVASRQSKQVRLLDRSAIPVQAVYGIDLAANDAAATLPAQIMLRTTNDAAHHLGLPLPSGRIAVFAADGAARVLLHESGMRDLAVAEEVQIDMGAAPDVQVKGVREETSIDSAHAQLLPLLPRVLSARSARTEDIERVEISNARAAPISFELRLQLEAGAHVIRADHPLGSKNGRPIFRLVIPARATATLRYQTERGA